MNPELMAKLLPSLIRSKGQAEITVTGISMNPTLYEGDRILVQVCNTYAPGDLLVYSYKNEGLLVHRLLHIGQTLAGQTDTRFYCKGDNAFRLEDLSQSEIIGKVISVNGHELAPWPDWKQKLSYDVHRQFIRCRYDTVRTRMTDAYRLYASLILRKEDMNMTYQKNNQMDFIPADQTSLAVFDPESGTTWFFDETGIDILDALEDPCDIDTLLNRLCQIYDAQPDEIRADVEEFLADTVEKKVVLIQCQ